MALITNRPEPVPMPTIGRIVHYVSHGTPGGEYPSQCRAAIVTATDPAPDGVPEPGQVFASLAVITPEGMFFNRFVLQDGNHTAGTWHWPEREGS
ncbi:hypothetical protein SLA_2407 [Streptomyces laurentii]|uniref:Uncharacterized protein n=1 Tax=Streptomyces laurentii TaxID=39478 RepID=A0A160NYI2_STRLU|nr:hypothetical protein SLA_2407 [Streptomyces laurentii]